MAAVGTYDHSIRALSERLPRGFSLNQESPIHNCDAGIWRLIRCREQNLVSQQPTLRWTRYVLEFTRLQVFWSSKFFPEVTTKLFILTNSNWKAFANRHQKLYTVHADPFLGPLK